MDEKISLKSVDRYAEAYARHLCGSFFNRKEKISGPEILGLSNIQQVNLFVISQLLKAWRQESEKLKSPYFDYTAPDVQQALTQFQNTLSNHILLSKEDFLPLLTKAVSKTIYLILDPYDFYTDILSEGNENKKIEVVRLKAEIKYIKINKPPLEKLVTRLEENRNTTVSGNEAFAMLDQILEEVNFTPEEIEPYLQQLNGVVPLKLEDLYEAKPKPLEASNIPVPPAPSASSPSARHEAASEVKQTLADDLAKKKVVRLKENLTINQKFMFTKVLFHGDFEIFTEAIERIDRMDDIHQASAFLNESYPHWDKESEEFIEFMEILERRFS
jgi:hypothetical protein